MANAKKCDRCGKFYENYNSRNSEKEINGIITLNIDKKDQYFNHGPYDLCPRCSKELMDWFWCR